MAGEPHEPTELIYEHGPSWAPAVIAAGIALAAVSAFGAWYWVLFGAAMVLIGAAAWWGRDRDEISRMRREQPTDTAVVPAQSIRRD